MVGRVGGDEFGRSLLESLRQSGVDTTRVVVDESVSSGIAVITVDDRAENSIVIIPGANGSIGEEDLLRLEIALRETDVLLLQLEVPLEAVVGAAKLSKEHRVPVVLDPAPARQLPSELYSLVDILTPNMTEATALVGFPVVDEDSVVTAAGVLLERGIRQVIVKMGRLGAYAADSVKSQFYPAIPIDLCCGQGRSPAINAGTGRAARALGRIGSGGTQFRRRVVITLADSHGPGEMVPGAGARTGGVWTARGTNVQGRRRSIVHRSSSRDAQDGVY
jgi:ribokinase